MLEEGEAEVRRAQGRTGKRERRWVQSPAFRGPTARGFCPILRSRGRPGEG